MARVAASLVVEYSPVTFVLISAMSLRIFTAEYIFLLCSIRSGGSSLLVINLPLRGEMFYEGIFLSVLNSTTLSFFAINGVKGFSVGDAVRALAGAEEVYNYAS